jgi:hypothetical protein
MVVRNTHALSGETAVDEFQRFWCLNLRYEKQVPENHLVWGIDGASHLNDVARSLSNGSSGNYV